MGRSFGGLLATNLVCKYREVAEKLISGVILITPYYRLYTEKLYSYEYIFKAMCLFKPHFVIKTEFKELPEVYLEQWKEIFNDPTFVEQFTPTTGLLWINEQRKANELFAQSKLPFLCIEATDDDVVDNPAMRDIMRMSKHRKSRYVILNDADHTTICYDQTYASRVIRESI